MENQTKEKILMAVDALQEELLKVICDTVQIPSVSPHFGVEQEESAQGESRVNRYMEKVMTEIGLKTDLWEEEDGRANLVGTLKGSGGGRSLLFNGHVDVVPAGDPNEWKEAEAWSAEIKDGKIWGRGSADMKGGNAACVFALKAILNSGLTPKGDVIIQHVVGEECMDTDAGTGAALKRGYTADAAIVVEPTSSHAGRLNICPANAGIGAMVCTVTGKPVHCSMRDELVRAGGRGNEIGVSAIDKGFLVYQALMELEKQWGQSKTHPLYTRPGHFTVGVSIVHGGVAPSIVPDKMVLEVGFIIPPKCSLEELKQEVDEFLTCSLAFDPWLRENPPTCEWVFSWPGYEMSKDEEICKTLAAVSKHVHPDCGTIYGFPAVDDAVFIHEAGIPVVSMGPGKLNIAHGSNEYVEICDIMDATRIYALTIAQWCGI